MREVTKEQVAAALRALDVQPGDGLLVHSAVQFLGRPVGGIAMYWEALQDVAWPGTIAVPTFNFSFARGEVYDPETTPSVGMGAFSEYLRRLPEARRTLHPMQSLAVIGEYADDLAGRDTPSAFDPGSAFERMLELGFKILLLGADIDAVSMFHYSEQRLKVPYRYWKEFTGPVCTTHGVKERTYCMYVRDMALDPKLTLHGVRDYLKQNGQYFSAPLNYGKIDSIYMTDFVAAVDRFLLDDPYSLVI
jgi:aminoglycoside 3-N-acetyltransferase